MIYLKRGAILFIIMSIIVTALVMIFWRGSTRQTFMDGARVIVLDPGHGGFDGGAVSKNGTVEKELNLQIAAKLQEKLRQKGYYVVMTRCDDKGVGETENGKITKKEDMEERRRIMNDPNTDIFVSIHMNQFAQSKYKGAQVFYSKNTEKSRALAQKIQTELRNMLDVENTREIKAADDSIYLMKKAKPVAVLVECGFLSNAEEEALLKTEAYQEKAAEAICRGIENYFAED